jgi:ectoine hydroxylase-related dioxygenase (phytanoyl-CoA dioxygenase family)
MNLNFDLKNHGFCLKRQACPTAALEAWRAEFELDAEPDWTLLDSSASVKQAADSGFLKEFAQNILGPECFPTHAILYNRTAANNTAQEWHQDTTALENGLFVEVEDAAVFQKLLSIRVSLDDCSFFDGALKLCPSSHKHGRLTPKEVKAFSIRPFSSPEMQAGDVLLMHPLTIHASGASQTLKPRRVIHVVFRAS